MQPAAPSLPHAGRWRGGAVGLRRGRGPAGEGQPMTAMFWGWVRRRGDVWRLVSQAATLADAEREASEWAARQRLTLYDLVATPAGLTPVKRQGLHAAPNVIEPG